MNNNYIPYEDFAKDIYKHNPQLVLEMLQESLQEGEIEEFLAHLKIIAKASENFTDLAKKAGINEKVLHETLSKNGNPNLKTLLSLLDNIGLQIQIIPKA